LDDPKNNKMDRIPARVVRGSIRRGEILSRSLAKAGVPNREYRQVLAEMDPTVQFRKAHVGDQYRVELNQKDKILALTYTRSPIEIYKASLNPDGATYKVEQVEVPIRREAMQIGCMIQGTLYESLLRCSEDGQLASKIIGLLSFDLNLYQDVRNGDRLRFVVDKEFVNGKFYRYGPIQALDYRSKFKTTRLFHFDDGTPNGDYYKEDGTTVKRDFLRSPLQYTRVSSGYQKRRYHPVLHKYKQHLAIDYAAPTGTPVWTVADGTVTFRRRRGASGNLVVIKHDDGYKTYYAHLHRFRKKLKVGDKVKQGQVVGYVGSTGRATGPHLHFAVKKGRKTLNPLNVVGKPTGQLVDEQLAAFQALVKERLALLQGIDLMSTTRRRL